MHCPLIQLEIIYHNRWYNHPQSLGLSHRKTVSRQPAAPNQNSDRLRAKYKVCDINFQDIKLIIQPAFHSK